MLRLINSEGRPIYQNSVKHPDNLEASEHPGELRRELLSDADIQLSAMF